MAPDEPEGFGTWYDDRQGDTGDPWHRTLIDPGLLERIGTVPPGCRVLDVGCGNGYLARRFARAGARVVGIDAAAPLLARARSREAAEPLGITYLEGDAASPTGLAEASIDLAFANLSLIDIAAAEGVFDEVARVVVDGGRFVFSLSHPCFDVDTRSAWVVRTAAGASTVYRQVTDYRRPHADRYRWNLGTDRAATTVGYHRPLSWYAHQLRRTGWVIVDLGEPAPQAEFEGRTVAKAWLEEIPLHLVVEARREPRRGAARRTGPRVAGPKVKRPTRFESTGGG